MVDRAAIQQALSVPLRATNFSALGALYRGKVRDNYTSGDCRYIVTTDRISAFDRVLGDLPLKGQVLQWISTFWFEQTRQVAPNHYRRTLDPNIIEVDQCEPLGAEMIVRAYITGVTGTSMWTHYARGERTFCGHDLPDGLTQHQRLDAPLLTPSSKAPRGEHDVSMSRADLIAGGFITARDFDAAAELAMVLFAYGQKHCADRGLLLVDTKYELGKRKDGTIVVIDEIHTPDSSRFWWRNTYDERMSQGLAPASFDKEYVRRWLREQGFSGEGPIPEIPNDVKVEAIARYIEACETIAATAFIPDLAEPTGRMEANISKVEKK